MVSPCWWYQDYQWSWPSSKCAMTRTLIYRTKEHNKHGLEAIVWLYTPPCTFTTSILIYVYYQLALSEHCHLSSFACFDWMNLRYGYVIYVQTNVCVRLDWIISIRGRGLVLYVAPSLDPLRVIVWRSPLRQSTFSRYQCSSTLVQQWLSFLSSSKQKRNGPLLMTVRVQ